MKTYLRHRIQNVVDVKELIALEYLDFEGKYKEYVEKHNENNPENQIGFAFVRDRNIETDDGRSDYELLFSNTAWTDELDNSNWRPINDLF